MASNKTVLLVSEKISDRIIMLSELWERCGYSTCIIYCIDSPLFNKIDSCDLIIQTENPSEIVAICKRTRNKLIHYFNYGPDILGSLLIAEGQEYIYDYKDLFYGFRIKEQITQKDLVEIEIVRRAKCITHRDHQVYPFLTANKIEYPKDRLTYVPEYFKTSSDYEFDLANSIELRKNSDDIKIVMTGGYPPERNQELINNDGIGKALEIISQYQNLHLTIIGNYSNINSIDQRNQLMAVDNNIVFKRSMVSEDFDLELLNYDYAIHAVNLDVLMMKMNNYENFYNYSQYCGSARNYSFIKAGLPILMGKSMRYNLEVLKDSGFSIDVFPNQYDFNWDTLSALKKTNYRKKILQGRNRFSFDASIELFEKNLIRII
jgi:hypothetical protein